MEFKKFAKRFFTLDRHHTEGFTLVELIVVIAILAILAAVAIPAYSGYINKANEAADTQVLSAINTAIQAATAVKYEKPKVAFNLPTQEVIVEFNDADILNNFNTYFGANSPKLKYYIDVRVNDTTGLVEGVPPTN